MSNSTTQYLLIERAAEIWANSMFKPFHDNGDTSRNGAVGMVLANTNAQNTMDSMADGELKQKIANFRCILIRNLKANYDESLIDESKWFDSYLNTDYGPGQTLAIAAKEAEIPDNLFSIKSTVAIHDDCVRTSFGYGASHTYHYPLPDGKWLLTTLSGSAADVSKLIDHAMGSNEMGFIIEA